MSESAGGASERASFIRSPRDFWGGIALIGLGAFALWASRDLPGMLEVSEMNAAAEEGFYKMYQAAREWDGKTHIVHRIESKQPA